MAKFLTRMCSLTTQAAFSLRCVLLLAQETADKVLSQLKGVIRVMYSSPQLHGARVVATVLNDHELTATWGKELKEMSDRIIQMRWALVKALADVTCPTPSASFTNWDHITSQIGMFAYTGLSKAQVRRIHFFVLTPYLFSHLIFLFFLILYLLHILLAV